MVQLMLRWSSAKTKAHSLLLLEGCLANCLATTRNCCDCAHDLLWIFCRCLSSHFISKAISPPVHRRFLQPEDQLSQRLFGAALSSYQRHIVMLRAVLRGLHVALALQSAHNSPPESSKEITRNSFKTGLILRSKRQGWHQHWANPKYGTKCNVTLPNVLYLRFSLYATGSWKYYEILEHENAFEIFE